MTPRLHAELQRLYLPDGAPADAPEAPPDAWVDAQGRVRQTVHFEVRGATLRAGAGTGPQGGKGARPAAPPSGKATVQEPARGLVLARQP